MLPDTSGRFGLFQVFDWNGVPSRAPLSTSQIESLAPHEDLVWGAFNPGAWNAAHPGMWVSRYTLPVEDNNSASGNDLAWFQANHPDWILYACKSDGTPTKLLAWSGTGFPDVPLDFSNPAVVQYQVGALIHFLKANGYNALAADNTDLLNYLKGGNPNFGQTTMSGAYGCGTYDSSGAFHRVFNGPLYSSSDTAFVNAMVNWVTMAASMLHQAGLKLIINHPLYNHVSNPNEAAMLAAADATVDERGFTDYGKYQTTGASVLKDGIEWAQYAQSHGVAFLVIDYLCSSYQGTAAWNNGGPCPASSSQIPAPQVDWALATYALINNGGADVYISPQGGEEMSYRPEYSTRYGSACSALMQPSTNVFERKFQNAVVWVNASGVAYSASLAAGQNYSDIEGRPVTNPLMIAPADAYVLLTNNGCL